MIIKSIESICSELGKNPELSESLKKSPDETQVSHPLDVLFSKEHKKLYDLAKHIFAVIVRIEPRLNQDTSLLGCFEMLRIAELTAPAFLDYCTMEHINKDAAEWRNMLQRSAALPDKFMAMSNGAWKTFSTAYGLRHRDFAYPECSFIVDFNKQHNPYHTVNDAGWQIATEEVRSLGKEVNPNGKHVCPARGLLAKTIWINGVELLYTEGLLEESLQLSTIVAPNLK